ncbi:MAG: thiamine-phosphate kinase [Akkermansiaceae bacterium]
MKTVGELGEEPLIAELCSGLSTSSDLLIGPGDDCAVIETSKRLTLLKTDAVVEGVHYLKETPAQKVGWKAVARVLSDFAAMGGNPNEFLITLALTEETPVRWARALYRGMNRCLAQHGGVIVGGETTSLPKGSPTMVSVAGRGTVTRKQLVTRSGGKHGDAIFVTGRLGGSLRGKHLTFTPRLAESDWLTRHFKIRSMMDLSDGLAKDLPRLAEMSGCGFQLKPESIPRSRGCTVEQALGDGEDFELLFTVSKKTAAQLEEKWSKRFPKLPLSLIGSLQNQPGDSLKGGWDHFRGS